MTKLSKNEKILRKGNEKWKNFLAEGAFKKTVTESIDFNTVHFADSMEPEELALLNIPEEEYKTKSKEEVEAIDAAVKKAHEQAQYGVELRSTATRAENEPIMRVINSKLDATRAITGEKGYYVSSGPEEDEEYRMTYSNDMPSKDYELSEAGMGEYGKQDAAAGRPASKVGRKNKEYMDAYNQEKETQISSREKKFGDALDAMSEARMGEYGKIDAEDGNPPTKIGRGNEEYMAAYNAVLQARGEEPLDIQQPDQAFLDALRSGQLQEVVDKRARQLLSEGLTPEQVKEKILEEGLGDFIRKGADFVKAKTGLGRTTKTRELYNKMKFEKDKYFEFRDKFYPDAKDVRNFMEFVEQNARKQGGGGGGLMSDLAYRAISKEKFKTMDSPITYLKQARKLADNIEKMMLAGAVDQKGDKTFKVIRSMAESIMKDFEQARAYLKELRVAIKRARKSGDAQALKDIYNDQVEHERYLNQSQARADKAFAAKAKEAERQARKDKPKDDEDIIRGKSTQRFGMATNLEENKKKRLKLKESNMEMSLQSKAKGKAMGLLQTAKVMAQAPSHEPAKGYAAAVSKAAGEIVDLMVELEGFQASRTASLEEAREIGEGDEVNIIGGALTGAEGKVIELTTTDQGSPAFVVLLSKVADKRVYGAAGDEVIVQPKFVEHKFYSGDFGMELYDIDEKKNLKEEVIEDFEIELEGGITFADVEEAGLVTPGVDSVIDNGDGYAQVYSEPEAMAKMAKTLEAMTGVMVSPKSHGAVDERSKDDERDLEEPVKYGSGAELEFDKKAQKFYDRKRDMYIDDPEEEDNLIKEKDEKEFAKIFATAKDMLVLSARSRVPVNLKSVQSALDVIRVPSDMEKGKLIVKNEYVIADKDELPESAKQISFTRYAMDYLSNLEGEQQDLPLG